MMYDILIITKKILTVKNFFFIPILSLYLSFLYTYPYNLNEAHPIKKLLKSYKLSSKSKRIIDLAHLLYLFRCDKLNLTLSYPVIPKESDLTILMVQVILLSDYLGVIFQ